MAISKVVFRIAGKDYTLSWDATSQSYKATITAPSKSSWTASENHYYATKVTATDNAGNSVSVNDQDPTYGDELKLVVKERNKPVITVTYPTKSSVIGTSSPTIRWKVVDDDSGVNPGTISIKLDSGSVIISGIQKTEIDGGYECSYKASGLSDGSHSFVLNAKDYDGNAATAVTTPFKIDTIPPVLTVSSPEDGLITNEGTIPVTGITNDATSSPVSLKVNDVSVPVSEEGTFNYTFKLEEGENEIRVVATDSSGKSTTVTRTVMLDTYPPIFESVSIVPNPVDAGATYVVSVVVKDE